MPSRSNLVTLDYVYRHDDNDKCTVYSFRRSKEYKRNELKQKDSKKIRGNGSLILISPFCLTKKHVIMRNEKNG